LFLYTHIHIQRARDREHDCHSRSGDYREAGEERRMKVNNLKHMASVCEESVRKALKATEQQGSRAMEKSK
jgi:hypothetical protein